MFILRKINGQGLESNIAIGYSYNFVNRETHYEEFCKWYKTIFEKDHVADDDEQSDRFSKDCYGFVVYNQGSEVFPLYKKQRNYIMTGEGKTFSNLTFKE